MPTTTTPTPQTPAQLEDELVRLLLDKLEGQNTAAVVRQLFRSRDNTFFNKATDRLPVGRLLGLVGTDGRLLSRLASAANQRPGGPFYVRHFLVSQQSNASDTSAEGLDSKLFCLGCSIHVELGEEAGEYRPVYDEEGPLSVSIDGNFTSRVNARLVKYTGTGGGEEGGPFTVSGITEGLGGFAANVGGSFSGTGPEFWAHLLKKPYGPNASIYVDNPQRQYGGSTVAVLHWSVSRGTSPITEVTVAGQVQPAGQTSGTVTTSAALNVGSSFAVVVKDAGGLQNNAITYVTYGNKRFWGVSSQDPMTLNDAQLSALLRNLSSEFSEGRQQEREFDCTNQYIVFGWIASAGAGNYFLNGLANTAFQSKTFAFDNGETGDGHTQTFRVSRNGSLITGHFSAKVS